MVYNNKTMKDYNTNILTPKEVYRFEESLFNLGMTVDKLMEKAVQSAKTYLLSYYPKIERILVLAGSGNNGADGILLAKDMRFSDIIADVALLGAGFKSINSQTIKYSNQNIKAQTEHKKTKLQFLDLYNLTPIAISKYDLIVDAIFGIGGKISRDESFIQLTHLINSSNKPVFTIDIASGSSGYDGEVAIDELPKKNRQKEELWSTRQPIAIKSDLCLTFFSKKTGQILTPAKSLYKRIIIDSLGRSVKEIAKFQQDFQLASIDSDFKQIYKPKINDNKYSLGHLAIIAGDKLGASVLSALSAYNSACGLVTIYIPKSKDSDSIADFIAVTHPNIMTKIFSSPNDFVKKIISTKVGCLLVGPGLGNKFDFINFIKDFRVNFDKELSINSRSLDKTAMTPPIRSYSDLYKVFDAEALTSGLMEVQQTSDILDENTILTPHMGEFSRLTGSVEIKSLSKLEQLLAFYKRNLLKSMILLKGNDSILVYDKQPIVISDQASPELAQAGSGDILAGFIGSLLAQTSQKKYLYTSSREGAIKQTNESMNLKAVKAVMFMQGQLPKFTGSVIDQVRLCYQHYILR